VGCIGGVRCVYVEEREEVGGGRGESGQREYSLGTRRGIFGAMLYEPPDEPSGEESRTMDCP
jgi:hypothetical protein